MMTKLNNQVSFSEGVCISQQEVLLRVYCCCQRFVGLNRKSEVVYLIPVMLVLILSQISMRV